MINGKISGNKERKMLSVKLIFCSKNSIFCR